MRVIDFFDSGVELYPNNTAFLDKGGAVSYKDASRLVGRIAGAIRGRGYKKSTHIGILAPNSSIAFISLLGLFRSEGVWLPINPRNPVAVNADLLARFDCEILFFHSSYAEEAMEISKSVQGIREFVCIDGEDTFATGMGSWCEGYPENFVPEEECEDDLFAIFPTGGTTGKSKGVMISNKNIECMLSHMYAHFSYYDETNHLVVAPMTHTAGIFGCLHFARGGTNTILSSVDAGEILRSIEEDRITHLFLPPTVLYMMLAHADVGKYDYSSLQHFYVAAAPTSLSKLKEAIGVFGPVMSEVFGQSEAPATITLKAPWDYLNADGSINEARLSSVGRPGVFNKVAIIDDEGQVLPPNSPGEICVRGSLVTLGYYKNPKATAEVRAGGWHHTGDVGVMSEDGFISIVDRKKDMIISGGFNVYPNEVEQILCSHSAVQDCAVIGVPDEKWGEAVKAIVQLKPSSTVDEIDLIAIVKEKLGSVKAPKSVEFIQELPRSPVGKVLKKELRDIYWKERTSMIV